MNMDGRSSPALSLSSTIVETGDKIGREPSQTTLDGRPLNVSRAMEGTPAFCPLSIGEARIEGTFNKITYCNFKGKPVCIIVIDLDFEYHEGCLFKDAKIRLNVESESESDDIEKAEDDYQSVSTPKQVLQFGPRNHFGMFKTSRYHDTREFDGGHVGNEFVKGPEIKICRKSTLVRESRWQVQGRADRKPRGQIYTWSVFGNKAACKDVASDKPFPRKVSVWMAVEHENKRFHADIEITGRCHGHWLPQLWSSRHVKRGADRKTFEPAPSTNSLDIVKLSQAINERNGALNIEPVELDLESCFATKAALSKTKSEGRTKSWILRRRPLPIPESWLRRAKEGRTRSELSEEMMD